MNNIKRISKELKELNNYINESCLDNHRILNIDTVDNNLEKINITCIGPKYTPYEEIILNLQYYIPSTYPNTPPKVYFLNKIYHSNISIEDGSICLDILKDNWKPIYTLLSIYISLQLLLIEPNPESPLNNEAARYFIDSKLSKENKYKYYKMVQIKSI